MPMDESTFTQLQPEDTSDPPSPTSSSGSLFAHMIQLNQLLYRILMFNTQVVSKSLEETSIEAMTAELSRSLDDWYADVPDYMRFTPQNLASWAGKGCGRTFAILHINHNYAGQLLYFRYLYLCQDSIPSSSLEQSPKQQYASRCKDHADGLCSVIHHANETPDSDVMYPLMAHILVIASTTQLFTLLFSPNGSETAQAKRRLERNFEILTLLQKYWPNLDASFSKFRAFHQHCLRHKDETFRLDMWMLRFILDYARPIDERDESGGEEVWSFAGLS